MALRRRKRKEPTGEFAKKPVRCGICKDESTFYTVLGGISTGRYGGNTCCDKCFETLKAEDARIRVRDGEKSEGEYQIERRWGI